MQAESWAVVVSIIALVVSACVAIITYFQLRAVKKANTVAEKANEVAAVLSVVNFLESAENMAARASSYPLASKPFAAWTAAEKKIGAELSGMWEVVAELISSGFVPEKPIVDLYRYPLRRQWNIVRDQVMDMRTSEPDQRKKFERLAAKAATHIATS